MKNLPENIFINDDDKIDFKQTFLNYLTYWPWFLISLLLCITAGYFYLKHTPKIYQTTAKIKIVDGNNGMSLPTTELLFNNSSVNLDNEIEILHSYPIIEKVVDELNLDFIFYKIGNVKSHQINHLPFTFEQSKDIDSLKLTGSYEVLITEKQFEITNLKDESISVFPNHTTYDIEHSFPFQIKIENKKELNSLVDERFLIQITSKKQAVIGLKRSIEIAPVGKKSDILELSIKGQSPLKSERIINTLINKFNEDGINDRQLISKRTINFIDDRFVFLTEELDSIETNKKDFKQHNNLVFIESDTEVSLKNRAQSEEEVFRVSNQLALAGLLKESLNINKQSNNLLPANIGLENSSINSLIENFNSLILNRNKLINSGGINNPLVKQLDFQINDLRLNLNQSLDTYKKQLLLSQKQLKSRNSRNKSEIYGLPQKEKLLRAINRQQTIKESLYLLLLQKREEAAISLAVTEPSIKVVEYALSNSSPIFPNSKVILIGAVLVGFLLPFAFFFILFSLDNKLHGKKDIENITKSIPVIGEIPKIKEGNNTLFTNPSDRSILAESFRILSSNVNFLLPIDNDNLGSVIYSTSTIKGEGKTFISLNLSLALASLNKKVLLIGADLRNPQLHTFLKTKKSLPGLSNYLHDKDFHWENALLQKFNKQPSHYTLISGEIPPNPPNLLTNGRFKTLLEEAKLKFDFIIVDTAPTISVTDTLLISSLADATIFVTRANFTEKELLEYSIDLAKTKKVKNMAYVVNAVGDSKKSKYGYNYGYSYGYNESES